MWRKIFVRGFPYVIFLFLCNFCFNFDFQAMVFTDPEKFALVEIFIEEGRSYVRFVENEAETRKLSRL